MYLHSVIPFYIVVFIVSGGVRHSHPGFKLPTLPYLQCEFVWMPYKQIHHLLFCCVPDKRAALQL